MRNHDEEDRKIFLKVARKHFTSKTALGILALFVLSVATIATIRKIDNHVDVHSCSNSEYYDMDTICIKNSIVVVDGSSEIEAKMTMVSFEGAQMIHMTVVIVDLLALLALFASIIAFFYKGFIVSKEAKELVTARNETFNVNIDGIVATN